MSSNTAHTNQQTSNGRIIYWDVAKCVAIFCVIWSHCLQNMTTDVGYWINDSVSQFICSFNMPLFMFISGYFAYKTLSKPFFRTMKRKFSQLIIPSITWFLIISLLAMLVHREFTVNRIWDIAGALPYSYWFLKSLFMCYLITLTGAMLYRWQKWTLPLYALIIFAAGEWLNYVSTISMLPFFLTGILFHLYEQNISNRILLTIAVYCFFIYIILYKLWDSIDYNFYLNPFYHDLNSYYVFLIRTIIGLSGSIAILITIKLISYKYKTTKVIELFASLGAVTLGLYCIQVIIAEGAIKKIPSVYNYINNHIGSSTTKFIYDFIVTFTLSIIIIIIGFYAIKVLRCKRLTRKYLLGER